MNKEHLIEYCLSKSGAYLDFPFAGDDYAVIKLKNEKTQKYRIFAELFVLYNQNGRNVRRSETEGGDRPRHDYRPLHHSCR